MTRRIERDTIYRCRRFSAETIELCVRWYTTYRLSYRDLAAMMAEREVIVAHTTIMRWVLQYGLCSAMIAIWSLHRHFSVQLSPMDGSHGLPRSTSMGTRQPFEVCDCLARKITVGGKWKCAHADISTT